MLQGKACDDRHRSQIMKTDIYCKGKFVTRSPSRKKEVKIKIYCKGKFVTRGLARKEEAKTEIYCKGKIVKRVLFLRILTCKRSPIRIRAMLANRSSL